MKRLHGSTNLTELEGVHEHLRDFAAARDWDQFHLPKNLAMALSAAAGELPNTFQWLTEEQSRKLLANAKQYPADKARGDWRKHTEL